MRNGHRILSPVLAWKALSDPMEGPKNTKTVPDTFVSLELRKRQPQAHDRLPRVFPLTKAALPLLPRCRAFLGDFDDSLGLHHVALSYSSGRLVYVQWCAVASRE